MAKPLAKSVIKINPNDQNIQINPKKQYQKNVDENKSQKT